MGHRALLAYRRDDSTTDKPASDDSTTDDSTDAPRYDLHRSHWGGADFALRTCLSPETPYATDTHFAVDPDPVATDLSLAEIVADHLDFLRHEAFYRVSSDYETTAFHVVWFGLDVDSETAERSETVGNGALVEVADDADYFRGWVRGTKATLGDVLDRGAITRDEARDYLVARIQSWDADREVILPE